MHIRIFSTKNIKHHAHVFISKTEDSAVVVPLHYNGKGGFLYEDREPVVLSSPVEQVSLGQSVLDALRQTTIRQMDSATKLKPTDWPAFKASKAASVKQFEQNFISLLVSGANEMNFVYVIEGWPVKDAELQVTSSLSSSAPPAKLGERLISAYRACRDHRI